MNIPMSEAVPNGHEAPWKRDHHRDLPLVPEVFGTIFFDYAEGRNSTCLLHMRVHGSTLSLLHHPTKEQQQW
jgi:hypothetical protein